MKREKAINSLGGLLFLALGLYFVYGALELDLGTARRMGPGFFPLVLGCLVSFLALLLTLKTWLTHDPDSNSQIESFDWRSFAMISAGVISFAGVTYYFGLVPGTLAAVLNSTAFDRRLRWPHKLLLAGVLGLLAWLLFIVALQLPFSAFRLP